MTKSGRTRFEKLQNSWRKASSAERRQFLEWIGGADAGEFVISPTGENRIPIASGRYLTPQTIERIRAVMARRAMMIGGLLQEIGLPPEDRSVARALARNSSLRLSVVEALRDWLVAHSDKEP